MTGIAKTIINVVIVVILSVIIISSIIVIFIARQFFCICFKWCTQTGVLGLSECIWMLPELDTSRGIQGLPGPSPPPPPWLSSPHLSRSLSPIINRLVRDSRAGSILGTGEAGRWLRRSRGISLQGLSQHRPARPGAGRPS